MRYLFTALGLILAAALWWAVSAWRGLDSVAMSGHGYVAMGLGVAFSLLVGGGLMALVFYSHRHGYDDLDQDTD